MSLALRQLRLAGRVSISLGVVALLFGFSALSAQAAVTFVNGASHVNVLPLQNTATLAATTGNLLVATVDVQANGSGCAIANQTLSDNQGNTYIKIGASSMNYDCVTMYYAKNITGNPALGVKVTFSAGVQSTISVQQFAGVDTINPLDATSTGQATSGTSIITGAFTTHNADEVVVAGAGNYYGGTWTAGNIGGTGSTIASGATVNGGTGAGNVFGEYAILSNLQSNITASVTKSGTMFGSIIAAAFKGSGGGIADTQAPTTPANVTATVISASQINLSWTASTDNVGVQGYQVFRNGIQVATTTLTSFNDMGLAASTAYTYTVTAFDAAGNISSASLSAGGTTQALPPPDTQAPSVPGNLTGNATGPHQINLSWTASTDDVGIAGYLIYQGGSLIASTTQLTYNDNIVNPSTTYTYAIAAFDAAGNVSNQTANVQVTTPDAGPGTTPAVGTWTTIAAGGYPALIYGYDKSEYVSSRKLNCVWGGYRQYFSSEPNNALVCYSYSENKWIVMENQAFFHSSHESGAGHSVSVFAYITDKDTLAFQTDGSGSNVPEKLLAHWWWYDFGGLAGQDKEFTPRFWGGALTTLKEMMTYDQFDQKLIAYDNTGVMEACDPTTNACIKPTVSGIAPPSGLSSPNMVYNTSDHTMYIWGGGQNDMYTFACNNNACTTATGAKLTTTCSGTACVSGKPPSRLGAGMAYSTRDNIIVMTGGGTAYQSGFFNDTWVFNPAANTWTQITTPATYPNNYLTYDRLTYDSDSNVFVLIDITSSAYTPTIYAFVYSPALNYGRVSTVYTPPSGSLNLVTPTVSSQSWSTDPFVTASGTTVYLGWIETGSPTNGSLCGQSRHPYIQSVVSSSVTYYPSSNQSVACPAIDPEASGNTQASNLRIATIGNALWEAHEKTGSGGSGIGGVYARQWNGSAWIGGAVPAFFAGAVQYSQGLIGIGTTPTLAVIAVNTNTYVPESYTYVAQWNGSAWSSLGGAKLNINGAGSRALNAAIATDGINPATCWSEEVDSDRTVVATTPQIQCKQWNGSAWVRWGTTSLNQSTAAWANDPSMTYAGGNYYIAWTERTAGGNNKLYVCSWNGSSCPLVGGAAINTNAATGWAAHPSLATDGTNIFIGWEEQPAANQPASVFVKKWDGSSWTSVGGALNANPSAGSAEGVNVAIAGGQPVAIWTELTYGNLRQTYAKQWDGTAWSTNLGGAGTPPPPDVQPPAAPANLMAVPVSANEIDLSWSAATDNVGVAGYHVMRDGVQIATTTGASYADTGLATSTTYSYAIAAFDAAGNISPASSPATGATFAGPDTTSPMITLAAQDGAGQTIMASSTAVGQINLLVNANDPVVAGESTSGISSITLFLDGNAIASTTATSTITYTLNTSSLLTTDHTFTATARDTAGNSANSQSFLLKKIGFLTDWQ